ncbi:MAG: type III pantothenate kinase [Bacteroidia bacterium]
MKLVIDLGNTSTKIGIFNKSKLKKHIVIDGLISQKEFQKIISSVTIESVIISSVRSDSQKLENFIEKKFRTINLSATATSATTTTTTTTTTSPLLLPFKNLYKTPATLGRDRIANAAAAANLFPNKNVLIIDAGTCLKFDFVDEKSNYYGGSIAPGLLMRFKALHEYTGRLPLIQPKKSAKLIGQTTEDSIRSGVQQGMINEVLETVSQYEELFPGLNIILTGGDWRLFVEHLKKSIFADPFLTLKGLHYILEYNT